MITNCLQCGGTGCAYCNGIGQIEYPEFNLPQDRMLKEAFQEITKLKSLLYQAQCYLSTWLAEDDCGCEPEGHVCGREKVTRLVKNINQILNYKENP
jgi:hypothetical protein